MKRIILLYLATAVLSVTAFAVSLLYLKSTLPQMQTEPLQISNDNDKGYLLQSAVGHFGAQECASANGLMYIATEEGLFEIDIPLSKYTNILDTGRSLSCISPYGGYIYAIATEVIFGKSMFDSSERTHIVKIDYNTKEKTILYTAPKNRQICDMSLSFQGDILFTEKDLPEGGGFIPKNSVLNKMSESFAPEKIAETDFYYIYDDKLYLTKYDPETDCERLFIATISSPDKQTDTGINVGREISMGNTPMFYPNGDSIYYTDESYSLCRYDISQGKSERVFGFDDEGKRIYYYSVFDSKIILLTREKRSDESWCYVLYYLDEANKPIKITGDDNFNEGRKYWFEYIESFCTFPGNDEYFALITFDQNMDRRVYIIDNEMKLTMAMQSGEWDYEAFEKMKDGMPEVT